MEFACSPSTCVTDRGYAGWDAERFRDFKLLVGFECESEWLSM